MFIHSYKTPFDIEVTNTKVHRWGKVKIREGAL
jgi:hypothetical protein